MPGPYGVTPAGFVAKALVEIKQELEDDFKAAFGDSIGSNPDGSIPAQSVFGQIVGTNSEREALLWGAGEAVYASTDPDKASGAALDAVCAITGTVRLPERKSQVTLTATGDAGTVLLPGRVVSVQGAGTRFATKSAVTITLAPHAAWVTMTAYALGDRVYAGAALSERVYLCIAAGTSGMPGPSGTGASIVDGSATWRYLGDGKASGDGASEAEVAGPFAAVSGTLTEIETPVAGWKSTINIFDAVVGDYVETDAALRIRRENELEAAAKATVNAIRANILRVGQGTATPVIACTVFQNTSLVTNVDGVPGKAVEVLVLGGLDADIWQEVFDSVAGGIQAYGNTIGTVIDSSGNPHVVAFSRATEKTIWLELDIIVNAGAFPIDGVAQCKAAIIASTKFPAYSFGKNVTAWGVASPLEHIAGVLDVVTVRLGLAAAPIGTATIPIGPREIAVFDTSRILINVTTGTP